MKHSLIIVKGGLVIVILIDHVIPVAAKGELLCRTVTIQCRTESMFGLRYSDNYESCTFWTNRENTMKGKTNAKAHVINRKVKFERIPKELYQIHWHGYAFAEEKFG